MKVKLFLLLIISFLTSSFLLSCGETSQTPTAPTSTAITTPKTVKTNTTKTQTTTTTTAQAPPQAPETNIFLNVPAIAGKSQAQVEVLLGPPVSSSSTNPSGTSCPCPKNTYKGDIEVIYMNGVADWITINETDNLSFSKARITQLGLPDEPPTLSSSDSIRWENIAGIKQVELFSSGQKIFYIEIKTNTE